MISKINGTNINTIAFKQDLPSQTQDQKAKFSDYKDYFVKDAKKTIPAGIILGAVWSLFDLKKGKNAFVNSAVSNIAFFTIANVIFSGVQAFFKAKGPSNQ